MYGHNRMNNACYVRVLNCAAMLMRFRRTAPTFDVSFLENHREYPHKLGVARNQYHFLM